MSCLQIQHIADLGARSQPLLSGTAGFCVQTNKVNPSLTIGGFSEQFANFIILKVGRNVLLLFTLKTYTSLSALKYLQLRNSNKKVTSRSFLKHGETTTWSWLKSFMSVSCFSHCIKSPRRTKAITEVVYTADKFYTSGRKYILTHTPTDSLASMNCGWKTENMSTFTQNGSTKLRLWGWISLNSP